MAPRQSFTSPIATTPVPNTYRHRLAPNRQQEERIARYYTTEALDEAYNTIAYRSTPQIPQQRPVTARVVPSATLPQQARRYPVTVRTPR